MPVTPNLLSELTYKKYPSNWEKQDNAVSQNDVIEAFIRGREVGRNESDLALTTLLNQNIDKAKKISEDLFLKAAQKKIYLNSIHIKADIITSFLVLVVSSKDDYIKDEFRQVISLARELKNKNDSETFTISFTYTYAADTLNENSLDSDGFFLKYGGNQPSL